MEWLRSVFMEISFMTLNSFDLKFAISLKLMEEINERINGKT